jgi:eukaryotic-like serine/threonine-protein kinase
MSSANRESRTRPTPSGVELADRAASGAGSGSSSATIRALPPPPDVTLLGIGTPTPASASAQHTILGYTPPVEPAAADALPEDVLPPGSTVGDYEIIELIGAGGMGSVYAARNPVIDRQVAIKVISSELCRDEAVVRQFVIEARAANQIANRHVVDIHTLGTLPDGRPYLVMELLRGETLAQRLSYGPLDLDDALPILDQLAEAVEAAHAVPIVHRDLKPDNVFLEDSSDGPQVKILDFGIAKLAGDGGSANDTAQPAGTSRILAGTPHYMAPEQARAQLVGTPADLYALGLIAFEMLAGCPAFGGETPTKILVAQVQSPPPRLRNLRPDVPERLDDLIDRLLAKDPGCRPTATDVRTALRALYEQPPYPRAVPPVVLPLGERMRLWLQRPRSRALIATAAVAMLVTSVYLFSTGGASTADTRPAAAGIGGAMGKPAEAQPAPRTAPASAPSTHAEPVVAPLESVPPTDRAPADPPDRDAPIRDPF